MLPWLIPLGYSAVAVTRNKIYSLETTKIAMQAATYPRPRCPVESPQGWR